MTSICAHAKVATVSCFSFTKNQSREAGLLKGKRLTFDDVVARLRARAAKSAGSAWDAPQPEVAVLDVSTFANKKAANKKVANKKVANKKVANKKVANKKVANKKVANKKVANKKVANKKVARKAAGRVKAARKKTARRG